MMPLAALSPVSSVADAPLARMGATEDGFAPVLAALLAPGNDLPSPGVPVPPAGKGPPAVPAPVVACLASTSVYSVDSHSPTEPAQEDEDDPAQDATVEVPAGLAQPVPLPVLPPIVPPTLAFPSGQPNPSLTGPASAPLSSERQPLPNAEAVTAPSSPVTLGALPADSPNDAHTVSDLLSRFGATIVAPASRPISDVSADPGDVHAPNVPAPPMPQRDAPVLATALPALQAFGAALQRAVVAERRPVSRDPDAAIAAPPPLAPSAPMPVAEAPPLDMAQPRWPEAMMTRIEHIRDAQNSADTRIRLHPDALGAIEVALRREGDAVQVRLHAAEPATTKLLADAQPRLAELADAKGLKLAQQPFEGGQHERRQPATPPRPGPPAPVRAAPEAEPDTDTRLA